MKRRDFLRGATLAAAGLAAASCAQPTPIVVEKQVEVEKVVKETVVVEKEVSIEKVVKETVVVEKPVVVEQVVAGTKFKEAPMLAELVAAGKLPPVDERLPKVPSVYPVPDSIGNYGGTMRRGFKGVSDRWGPSKTKDVGLTHFNYWDLEIRPDIVMGWQMNADGTQWTMKLREGMKWSDGAPFTTSDWTWAFENVYSNADLTPAKSAPVIANESAMDDYTVVVTLEKPFPLFMHFENRGPSTRYLPAHYLEQFHQLLTDDKAKLDADTKAAGFNAWTEYFSNKNDWLLNPERPMEYPWVPINDPSGELFIMERNPYFHAVDPEGNQLPYIDRINHRLFATPDVFNMWIVNGEIDYQGRHVDINNYTLFKESEAKGGYKIKFLRLDDGETFCPNHDCKNPKVKEFFNDLNVRKAMNLAIDRQTIVDIAYDGLATPRQASPTSTSPFYYEAATNAYAQYDPDQANKLLDEAGYDKKDSNGFRLWKDGSGPVFFTIEGIAPTGTPRGDALQMTVDYLKKVGINCAGKDEERSLYTAHHEANETEGAFWGTYHNTLIHLDHSNPYCGEMTDRPWAGGWGLLYKNGPNDANASEPPADHWIRDLWAWWDEAEMKGTMEAYKDAMKKIMDVWIEQVPVVGILGEVPGPLIVKDGLMNTREGLPSLDRMADEHLVGTPILFWDEPEKHV